MHKKVIETVSLFPELNTNLITLLQDLTESEWHKSTLFPHWKVKDIVAHLLDTAIRRLSSHRDQYEVEKKFEISSYSDLIEYVTQLADVWALAFNTVSPKIIIELIEKYQNQLYEFLKTINPNEFAKFSVAWAGEEKSYNWFDIAREYTERWHHQMQIRDILNRPPLFEKHLYYPVLDTFMQGLPYHFLNINEKEGYIICVHITEISGGKWYLKRRNLSWELMYDLKEKPNTIITIENDIAWKIFVKWIDKNNLFNKVQISGDESLGKHLLEMTCIII